MRIRVDFDFTLFSADRYGVSDRFPISSRAADIMRKWIDDGHEVDILTARHADWTDECAQLLRVNGFPYVPVFSSCYESKLEHEWDVLIDDDDELYLEWLHVKHQDDTMGTLILFDQPYNSYVHAQTRALNWNDVEEMVDELIETGQCGEWE